MQKTIYFIRHGRTLYNLQKRVQGKGVDSDLDSLGHQQGHAFFDAYKHIPFERVVTSTLKRTIQTVAPFLEKGIPHTRLPELDEISWGTYEGKEASEELHRDYKNLIKNWGQGLYEERLEGGESATEMGVRLNTFVEQLIQWPEKSLLVCTHGGCLAFLMAILQKQPLSAMHQYKHHNLGLCLFDFDGEHFNLKLRDDIRHLESLNL